MPYVIQYHEDQQLALHCLHDMLGPVSRETRSRLEIYAALLDKWTRRINLIAPSTRKQIWSRHIVDSAQLRPLLPSDGVGKLIDLGSGAGLPGLILAILGGGAVTLIESDQRKAVFLQEVIRQTGATATVLCGRIEQQAPQQANIITARALAALPKLIELAVPHLASAGKLLAVKGRDWRYELEEALIEWSFDYEHVVSRTDPEGRILILHNPRRRRSEAT